MDKLSATLVSFNSVTQTGSTGRSSLMESEWPVPRGQGNAAKRAHQSLKSTSLRLMSVIRGVDGLCHGGTIVHKCNALEEEEEIIIDFCLVRLCLS